MSSGSTASPHMRTPAFDSWSPLVRKLWIQSSGLSNSANEQLLLSAFHGVHHVALLSASLRMLASSIHTHVARHQRQLVEGQSNPSSDAFTHLHSITLITNTFRYEWHFLLGLRLCNGSEFLKNITHLRIHNMTVSAYCPHNLLTSLTHLALPYLDLGNDFSCVQDRGALVRPLRLPEGIIKHPSLRVVVLTVDERKWLDNPYYQTSRPNASGDSAKVAAGSPRESFRKLVQWTQKCDKRIHVVLSPRSDTNPCQEWADAARGCAPSVWEVAAKERMDGSHGAGLPEVFPKRRYR
ncbi:uncharacterized protein BXZ73DRAFT_87650 [Epithele typhae]|uniref:uncharacterized protein n=1 Tax=Epithele typhae TaxID=378194 RepID=UPI0020082E8F|nr:uncharacterized protein BXZ73DRAFT_87650 [Epithele typhae]KAH9943292.1 hypothetical protein BXZ73DRAFT_87650 [Epithele typhae]